LVRHKIKINVILIISAFPGFSDTSQLVSLLQMLGYGGGATNSWQVNNNVQTGPTYNTENSQTSDSSTRSVAGQSNILSLLANRWDSIENQAEQRLENQPEYIAEPAERRLEKASDYFERHEEQQQNQANNNGWNSFLTNNWNSYGNNAASNQLDAVDDHVENRINIIENTLGEQVAEGIENRWDTLRDSIGNKGGDDSNNDDSKDSKDNDSEERNNWYDDAEDKNDDGNSWGNYNGGWSSSNTQSSNIWENDADDDWNIFSF
jgi:hypothetical protein